MRNHCNMMVMAVPILVLCGCASNEPVSLMASSGQESIIRNGNQALVSRKAHVVMLKPNQRAFKSGGRAAYTIIVRNMGGKPENLYESNIIADTALSPNKIQALRVLKHAELVQEENTRQAVAAFAVALGGAANAMAAANSGYSTTTGSYNAYGPGGMAHGSYSATTYNPALAQAATARANAETAANFATLQAEGERNLVALERSILKDHTVMPGEWYGGTIVMEPPAKPSNGPMMYKITVNFAGERHEFSIRQGV